MSYGRAAFKETFKPETALKRAEELIAQDQNARALSALHDVISNRRYRTWQLCLEEIMHKHVDLTVAQRKGKHARDGLMQYRAICQQVNVGSLEKVIHYFLDQAELKAKEAQTSSEGAAQLLAGEDLDAEGDLGEESPESILMRAVSGETSKDRTDREILLPWIKFLWESYLTVLDVTRSNLKLEQIYHDAARRAFTFCQRYQRKVEFRRLCDKIRLHHSQKSKYYNPEQRQALLQSPESFTLYMETRFKQLQVATTLDLWQEAYRSIEDIHGIITFFKKTPPTRQMIEYFDKLTKVFWVAKNYLFHAYACLKHHNLFHAAKHSMKKELTEKDREDLQSVASKVLIATLCIPFWERKNFDRQKGELFVYNNARDKNMRITTLLGSSTVPTRSSLLLDVSNRKISELCFPELRDLYNILEVEFDPLQICHRVNGMLTFMQAKPQLAPYCDILRRAAVVKMVDQACKVYDVMGVPQLCKLCPFYSYNDLETLLLEVAKEGYPSINLTFNHQMQTISLSDNVVSCDSLCGQLSTLNAELEPVVARCVEAVAPPKKSAAFNAQSFASMAKQLLIEREAILERKKVIEDRKERQENKERELARAQETSTAKQVEIMREIEVNRIKIEAQQREVLRKKQQEQQEAESQSRALFSEILQQKGSDKLRKAVQEDESLIKDQERLIGEAKKMFQAAMEAREKRLKEEAKKSDFFERACREDEKPILQKMWKEKAEREKESRAASFETTLREQRETWEHAIKEKRRFSRMEDYWERFAAKVVQAREEAARKNEEEEEEDQREEEEEEPIEEEEVEPEKEEESVPQKEEVEVPSPPVAQAPPAAAAPAPWRSKAAGGGATSAAPKPAAPPQREQPPPVAKPTPTVAAKPAAPSSDAPKKAYIPPSQRGK